MSGEQHLIALSAGGRDVELADFGLGLEHVNELMVRMSRRLLVDGRRLAYGGTLGNSDDSEDNLTNLLIDSARGWLTQATANAADVRKPDTWPLVNYSTWPFYTLIEAAHRAQLVGVCHFKEINPGGVDDEELNELASDYEYYLERDLQHEDLQDEEKKKRKVRIHRFAADALTKMREDSTTDSKLRIVWGGKIRGALGWMPGIAEEVLFSLEQGKPVLVLGGFGGCAGVLAQFLASSDEPFPESLKFETARGDPLFECMIADRAEQSKPQGSNKQEQTEGPELSYQRLCRSLTELRDKLHGGTAPIDGISRQTFLEALTARSPRRAIQLAQMVSKQVCR